MQALGSVNVEEGGFGQVNPVLEQLCGTCCEWRSIVLMPLLLAAVLQLVNSFADRLAALLVWWE